MEIFSKNSSHANACVCFIDIYFRHRFTSNIGQCDSVNVLDGVKCEYIYVAPGWTDYVPGSDWDVKNYYKWLCPVSSA